MAVLSVSSLGRNALLQGAAANLPAELPEQDMAVLMSAGWTREGGLRALLNFSGEAAVLRLFELPSHFLHQALERSRDRSLIVRLLLAPTQVLAF